MKNISCTQIAANMLSGRKEGDTGLLNYKLAEDLDEVNSYCMNAGGRLVSRQAIAIVIQNFSYRNPDTKLYGD